MRSPSDELPSPLFRDIELQVARVLNHPSFSRSQGPARLLEYLLRNLVQSGGRPATQQELATVLGLAPDFNPASNPLVRMHMSKLRKMLNRFAIGDGRQDLIILEIPRNQYQLKAVVNCDRVVPTDAGASLPNDDTIYRPVMLVAEFACEADGVGDLAADVAFQLVAMLAETTHVAAIGPALRSRLHSAGLDVRQFAYRCLARFALDGEILPGPRGLAVVVRILDVPSGEVCWSDWLDEPSTGTDPDLGNQPSILACRMLDKLLRFDALGQSVGVASGRASLQSEGGAAVL